MAALKCALPGFSFASELFLVIGLAVKAPTLAIVMIAFRSLHAIVTSVFVFIIFGSGGGNGTLEKVLSGASTMPALMDDKFARKAMPLCGGVVLLSMCDCTLLQFLPWKPSQLFTESKGFPALSMLRWCLSAKVVQGIASTVCQLIFLFSSTSAADKAIMTAQAKALFGMNITMAVVGVVMGLLMLCMKDGLLSRMDTGKRTGKSTDDGEDGFAHSDIYRAGDVELTTNPMMLSLGAMQGGVGSGGSEASSSTSTAAAGAGSSSAFVSEKDELMALRQHVAMLQGSMDILQGSMDILQEENRKLRDKNQDVDDGGDPPSRGGSTILCSVANSNSNSNSGITESVNSLEEGSTALPETAL